MANEKKFPRLNLREDSHFEPTIGPYLFNKHLRAMITPLGAIRHMEMMGDGEEVEFIPLVSETKMGILLDGATSNNEGKNDRSLFWLNRPHPVEFEYKLTHINIEHEIVDSPIRLRQLLAIPQNYKALISWIRIINSDSRAQSGHFFMLAKFDLGSPYYTAYSNVMGAFSATNRLWPKYRGIMVCPDEDALLVWAREMDIRVQLEEKHQPWSEPYQLSKTLEDSWALIQVPFMLEPGEEKDILLVYGGDTIHGNGMEDIDEIIDLYLEEEFEEKIITLLERDANALYFLQTPDTLFTQGAAISHKIALQLYEGKTGLMALPGHMYPRFYSRDSYWQMMGLLVTGHFEEVKLLIEHMLKFQNEEGAFPTSINLQGRPIYFTRNEADIDSAIFPASAILEYVRWSRDMEFGKVHWDVITKTLGYLKKRDVDGDGWLEQKPNQDWADTMKRSGKVNYCHALYYKLLRDAHEFGTLIGYGEQPEVKEYGERAQLLKEQYESLFWDEERGIYVDYISQKGTKKRVATQDACLAFIFGLADNREHIRSHLKVLKDKCWTQWGPGKQEPYEGISFGPAGFYHNGGVWLWVASFEALARFLFDNPEDAVEMLNKIKRYDFGENPYRAFYFDTNEWYDSRNGLNGEHNYKSCRAFTTGAGAHLWAVVHGLFGISLGFEGPIRFNPHIPDSWKGEKKEEKIELRNLRVGNERISKEFTL